MLTHSVKIDTIIAIANNILNTTPMIDKSLIIIAHSNTKLVFIFIHANIVQTIKVKSIKKNVMIYRIVTLITKQGQPGLSIENYLDL